MEFRDLKSQYQALKTDIDNAIGNVLEHTNFISGEEVKRLETELANYTGVKHCITCANGTDALSLALMAWDIKEGDAVFVPDFTFFASAETVASLGATPVFIDVDENTYNISAASLEEAIKKVLEENKLIPKVVVTVDLFGLPADYTEIRKITDRYQLKILEDGAQGFGGSINAEKVCSFGDISTTSFFPAKPLGCYGDGGAIFTNDDDAAVLIRSLCVHGKGSSKYENIRIGVNSRLDTIQAAILLVKFNAFKEFELLKVNEVAARYTEALNGIVKTPFIPKNFNSSWAQYTIQLKNKKDRDNLRKYLEENDIPTLVYYPVTMHDQMAFNKVSQYVSCTTSTKLTEISLSIPIGSYISEKDQAYIIEKILNYFVIKDNR